MPVGFDGNVNNAQQLQKLLKSMQNGKGVRTQKTVRPEMTKDGSIFNLVSNNNAKASAAQPTMNTQRAAAASGVVRANTNASIDDVQKTTETKQSSKAHTRSENKSESNNIVDISSVDFDNLSTYSEAELLSLRQEIKEAIDSDCPFFLRAPFEAKLNKVEAEIKTKSELNGDKVSEGNKKADERSTDEMQQASESGAKEANGGAAAAQKGTEKVNDMSGRTVNEEKNIKSAEAKLLKQQASAQKSIEKNIKTMQKEQAKVEQLSAETEQINQEIEALNEKAANTRAAGGENVDQQIGEISGEIQTRSAKATVNAAKIGKSTVAMHKLTTANGKTIKTLTKDNKAYIKSVNASQQQIQQNQAESNDFLDLMEGINDVSSKIALGGTVAKYTGMIMSKTGWPPTVAAGIALETAGTIAETAGNYGVCAANIGKTAVYAAQGNIMGALTSAGVALMSGATAVGNTKQMLAAADAAKAAGQASTEATKEVTKEATQEVTQEATKEVTQEVTKEATKEVTKEVTKEGAKTTAREAAKQEVQNGLSEAAQSATKDGVKDISNQFIKENGQIATKGIKGFMNGVALEGSKQSTTQVLMGLGSALSSAAAMFDSQDSGVTVQKRVVRNVGLRRRKVA